MSIGRIVKYFFFSLAILAGLFVLLALMKVLFVYQIYSFMLEKIITTFGLDLMLSRVVAIFISVVTILVLPWVISFLLFGRRKKELFIVSALAIAVCFLGLYYGTTDVFFDRSTGKPIKFYIKTLEGFKFSSTDDFDPKFGIKYKPITAEIIKECFFWEKTGKMQNIPAIKPGQYFNMITGEPMVWYSETPDGEIKLFSLPGYDPTTGELLKPMTKEVVRKKNGGTVLWDLGLDVIKKFDDLINPIDSNGKPISRPLYQNLDKETLEWYLRMSENSFNLTSDTENIGSKDPGFFGFGGGPWIHEYDVSAEKIIFIPPYYTVLGICYKGIKKCNARIEGAIIDSRGIKYNPILVLMNDKTDRDKTCIDKDCSIEISAGEIKRVLYIIKYTPPKILKTGVFSLYGSIKIKFHS